MTGLAQVGFVLSVLFYTSFQGNTMRTKVSDPTIPIFIERYIKYGIDGFVHGEAIHTDNNDVDAEPDDSDYGMEDVDGDFEIEKGEALHVGIDSEYVFDEKTQTNTILSYQYCLIFKNYPPLTGILYPKSSKVKDRWTLERLISEVIQRAYDNKYISQWSGLVNVYAHFLRADMSSFSDCFNFKGIQGIRGTIAGEIDLYGVDVATLENKRFKPQVMKLHDKNRNGKHTVVNFIDTMLLSPNQCGLATIGELIKLPKLPIPAGYSIDRMDVLLKEDKEGFEAYALRDAEIAVYYGLFMQVFVRQELKLKRLPMTLAGIGLAKYKELMLAYRNNQGHRVDLNTLFGKHKVQTVKWNKIKGQPVFRTETVLTPAKDLFASLATHAYMGGRNECFATGITPIDTWSDYDVASAYPVAMLHLKPLDYEAAYVTHDVTEFTCNVVGMAYVKFKFPENTRYPSLPVQSPNGLLYPLSGETYVTAPELAVAIGMECKIDIQHGVIVPFIENSQPLFLAFVEKMRGMRQDFNKKVGKKGSIMELLCKECINSLYGKTASGVKAKTGFEVSTGLSKVLPQSVISCPYLASYISGFIRALVSEQIASIPAQYDVLSITTDGFLTNAPMEAINLELPASKYFTKLFRLIDATGSVLECKHRVKQLVMMKTRGQLTLIADGTDLITAKCGIKPECAKELQNDWMIDLYLNRVPVQKVKNPQIISLRDQWLRKRDLINLKREIKINLEPDFKRLPFNPVMTPFEFNGVIAQHIYLESKPWLDVNEFMKHRAWFDGWRQGNSNQSEKEKLKEAEAIKNPPKSRFGKPKPKPVVVAEPVRVEGDKLQDEWLGTCLKTIEDWDNWLDFLAASEYVQKLKGLNIPSNRTTDEILRRLFIRAYVNGDWGLNKNNAHTEVAQFLTDKGYPTTRYDFQNVKSKNEDGIVIKYKSPPKLPNTAPVRKLLKVLQDKFPELNVADVVISSDI